MEVRGFRNPLPPLINHLVAIFRICKNLGSLKNMEELRGKQTKGDRPTKIQTWYKKTKKILRQVDVFFVYCFVLPI